MISHWRRRGPTPCSSPTLIREPLPLLRRLEDLKATHERLVNRHHGTSVVKLPAVVGGREQRHQLPSGEELVPILHHLVSPAHKVEVMLVQELSDNVLPEGEGHSTVILTPPVDFFVRVGPQEITQQARVGNVGGPHDALHLIQAGELGTKPPVHAEDLLVHHGSAREAVKAVCEGLPQLDSKAALALVVEAIDAVDGRTLVISPQNEEVFGVLDLVRQQEAYCFEGLLATVHVVAQEYVVGLWREAAVFKKPEEVVILTVDVATDLDGGLQLEEHGLPNEQIARAEAQHLDLSLREVHLLSGASPAHTAMREGGGEAKIPSVTTRRTQQTEAVSCHGVLCPHLNS